MTLAELGAILREAREARGMTVADAADRLKISGRILQGVEDGSDRVPRTVYVYHYIKDYARLVGIPAAEIGGMLEELEGFENINRPVIADNTQYTSVKPSMLPTILGILLKAVAVLALAGGAYMAYLHFFEGREYDAPVPLPSSVDAPAPQSGAPVWEAPAGEAPAASPAPVAPQWEEKGAEEADAGEAVSQPSLADAAAVGEPAEASPVEDDAVSPPPLPPAVPVVSVAEEVPAAPRKEVDEASEAPRDPSSGEGAALIPEGMHKVEVLADGGDCWLGFESDGRKQQRTLRRGDAFTLTFRDALTLKLGNAQAVRVIYDGQEQKRSSSARVTTLTFPAE